MIRKIIWLDDRFSQVGDYEDVLREFNIPIEKKETLGELQDLMIELKNKNKLDSICLVIDIMISNTPIVYSPKGWNGEKEKFYSTDNNGENAGIVFYEKFILENGEENFKKIGYPPIVFLTTIPDEADNRVFQSLNAAWQRIRERQPESVWICKWDSDGYDKLRNFVKNINKTD